MFLSLLSTVIMMSLKMCLLCVVTIYNIYLNLNIYYANWKNVYM